MTSPDTGAAAREIAESIVASARASGADPIAWVTGNNYMPPMRAFDAAEKIWQSDANADGELFAALVEDVEALLDEQGVYLGCPEWDNALFCVDLRRFECREPDDGETLQDDWQEIDHNEETS